MEQISALVSQMQRCEVLFLEQDYQSVIGRLKQELSSQRQIVEQLSSQNRQLLQQQSEQSL